MKNIKVIDEHGIERIGNDICSIDVGGSDYAFYWIEKDLDHDNIFVSKLIDEKTKIINIDDVNEKIKISDFVKNLITKAINSKEEKLNSNIVNIDGVEYTLSDVKINENDIQNFNISKTYITTVKKEVTKVYTDYYNVDFSKLGNNEIFNDIPSFEPLPSLEQKDNLVSSPVSDSSIIEIPKEVMSLEKKSDSVDNSANNGEISVDIPVITAPTVDETVSVLLEPEKEISLTTPIVSNSTPAFVETTPVSLEKPVVSEDSPVLLEPEVKETISLTTPSVNNPTSASVETTPVSLEKPVVSETSSVLLEPEVKEPASVVDDKLVFDVSKESNLKASLGEVINDTNISVPEIESVRDFGVENSQVDSNIQKISEEQKTSVLDSSKGSASNKFVMVVAILFFVASCIFLGYEVFNYIQLK